MNRLALPAFPLVIWLAARERPVGHFADVLIGALLLAVSTMLFTMGVFAG
jgi:hypothetical protein